MRLIQVAHGGGGDLVAHVLDGGGVLGDLTGHLGLLLGSCGDLSRHVGDEADGLGDLLQGCGGGIGVLHAVVGQPLAGLHQAHRTGRGLLQGLDGGLDLLGGVLGTARQHPHLVRHHGEAATLFTGTGRFDGRVQRQQVGLLGDALDGGEDA